MRGLLPKRSVSIMSVGMFEHCGEFYFLAGSAAAVLIGLSFQQLEKLDPGSSPG